MFVLKITTVLGVWLPSFLERANEHLSRPFNNLAGRSWLFDTLVSLPLENDLVKAAFVGGCFYAAWHECETIVESLPVRKMLLVTLFAAALTITTTKFLSHSFILPRPLMQNQKVFYLEDDNLVASTSAAYRQPLDSASRQAHENLLRGDVAVNDLGSFPSDHAGLFFALSFGIWLASRRYGRWALAWTLLVVVQAKLISGQHTLLDVIAGVTVGAVIVLVCRKLATLLTFEKAFAGVLQWMDKNRAVSSALLFAVVFECASTLTHIRHLLKFAAEVGRHVLRG